VGIPTVFHPAPAEAAATMVTMAEPSVLARPKPALVMVFVKSHSQVPLFYDMIRYIVLYLDVKPLKTQAAELRLRS
jgi:hypothetical protein